LSQTLAISKIAAAVAHYGKAPPVAKPNARAVQKSRREVSMRILGVLATGLTLLLLPASAGEQDFPQNRSG
jgi:hypothetical protein